MTDIITPDDLASWLRDDSLASNASLIQIVELTNELLDEEWASPVEPIPAKIRLLALRVAARGWRNNPATANLESITRTLDDASRTERYRTSPSSEGVFLTNDELAVLHGKRPPRSVRLVAYGEYGS